MELYHKGIKVNEGWKFYGRDKLFTSITYRLLGDFSARSSDWWPDDITSPEGTHINSLISMYGFDQIISDPTHALPASSSCIDLIFTYQPNLVVDSGVHPSLHTNCHHQIKYCNLNLMIVSPLSYEHLVWD